HREIELAWMPGNPFYNQTDSDRISNCDDQLPDDFENGTLTTFWEPRGSLTNKTNTDTYEMAYRTRYPDYSTYGDQEYLCYRAGKLFREDWKDDNKDWSDYGVLAKEQKKSFEKQFDSFSSVALLKEQPDQLIAKED